MRARHTLTHGCALGAVMLLGGCYLFHERPAATEARDAGVPDARVPAVDAWIDDPVPPGPDAAVRCEPRPPVAGRDEPAACGGPAPAGGTTRALLGAHRGLSVATDGCDVWAASASPGALWRLGRDGIWDELAATGVEGLRSHLVAGRPGELHLVVQTATSLVHRAYHVGETFGGTRVIAEGDVPRVLAPEPIVHRVSVRLEGRVPFVYRTDEPAGVWITDLATGDEPRALAGPTDRTLSMPRICRAGARRLVVVWSDDGRATAAVSDDGGESFQVGPIGVAEDAAESDATLVDVDCHTDGRALAIWLRGDVAHTAWLDRQGCWHDGDRIRAEGAAFYPHVWIGGDGALVSWRIRAGMTYGTAIVGLDGRLRTGPLVGPDANGDGQGDRHLSACAGPDRFAVLVQGERSVEGGSGTAHLSVLAADGALDRTVTLGPFGSVPIDLGMACDRHGRAAMLFVDGEAVARSWAP